MIPLDADRPIIEQLGRGGNIAICVTGVGASAEFSCYMVRRMPDLGILDCGQVFPRYRYDTDGDLPLFDHIALDNPIDNLIGVTLRAFQEYYPEADGDAVFYYCYGILHAPSYRRRWQYNLDKDLPHVPFAADFPAFERAGRRLAELHCNYESTPRHPLTIKKAKGHKGGLKPRHFRLTHSRMRWLDDGRQAIRINDHVELHGVPAEAHRYKVGGRTPVDWILNSYYVKRDPRSGIVNDANDALADPRDIVAILERAVQTGIESGKVIAGLPDVGRCLRTGVV